MADPARGKVRLVAEDARESSWTCRMLWRALDPWDGKGRAAAEHMSKQYNNEELEMPFWGQSQNEYTSGIFIRS